MTGGGEPAGALGDGARTVGKVRRRIMPLVVWLYVIAYLDRNNIAGYITAATYDINGGLQVS